MRNLLNGPEWLVEHVGWDPLEASVWETRFTVGNGYLGTRGTVEEGHRGQLSGTYLNGVYDSHDSPVIDLVNVPDWTMLEIYVEGVRMDVHTCVVEEHRRALDLRQGVLWRSTIFRDPAGRRTRLETLRFASMAEREVCAMRAIITVENHSSTVSVHSGIDGHRRNLDRLPAYPGGTDFHPEVKWEKWAFSKHLDELRREVDDDVLYLQMRTISSGIAIGVAAQTTFSAEPIQRDEHQGYEQMVQRAVFSLAEGQPLQIDKCAVLLTSRNSGADMPEDREGIESEQGAEALRRVRAASADGVDAVLERSRATWESMWHDCDCEVVGDPEAALAVRFGIYHLLIAANGDDPTVNIGAKSLSGEGYRGHVFWDTEIFMLPFFIYTQPQTARALLGYRHHTLPGARERSREAGTGGARYAWESADTGREECPAWTVDGVNRIWARDEEVHVSADVVFGLESYLSATGDSDFVRDVGSEILFETSRFWVDRVTADDEGGYSLNQVMGPDEFHSHVDNNAFTNYLARWQLQQAVQTYTWLKAEYPDFLQDLSTKISLDPAEPGRWQEVAEGLSLSKRPDGLIEQFDGYFDREDIPITSWDENSMPQYPEGYHHFNLEETMLLKQPDVVMLPFMFPDDFTEDEKRVNFEFYEARTLHKSSLSSGIHAIMGLVVGDRERASQYFRRSAFVDLHDNQGNTDEGMHIASAAGTWQILVAGFAGFRVMSGRMTFSPWLPDEWSGLRFRMRWHGHSVAVDVGREHSTFRLDAPEGHVEEIDVYGEAVRLPAGEDVSVARRD